MKNKNFLITITVILIIILSVVFTAVICLQKNSENEENNIKNNAENDSVITPEIDETIFIAKGYVARVAYPNLHTIEEYIGPANVDVVISEGIQQVISVNPKEGHLKTLYLPSTLVPRIDADVPLDNYSNCENIKVSENNKYFSDIDGVMTNKEKTTLIRFPVYKNLSVYQVPESITDLYIHAFSHTNLEEVVLGKNVKKISGMAFFDSGIKKSILYQV